MSEPATVTVNALAQRWNDGDATAADHLCSLCQPVLSREVGEETSHEWLSELRTLGPRKLGFNEKLNQDFLVWAVERIRLFEQDPHRKLVYSLYSGNDSALDSLYVLTHGDLVQSLNTFRDSLPDGAALDIVAEFFTDLLSNTRAGRFEYNAARGSFLVWARTVVRRRALSMLRTSRRLTDLPIDDQSSIPAEFILETDQGDRPFHHWISSALTEDQKLVFNMLVMGHEQQSIAAETGFGGAKVSKMLDEIRSRIADRMKKGGYQEALTFGLDRIRSGKGTKGLMPRLFLRYVAPTLIDTLCEDEAWAKYAIADFGENPRHSLWRMNPENRTIVSEVARKLAGLYLQVRSVLPNHVFCELTLQMAAEPWGKPIEVSLQQSDVEGWAAASADSSRSIGGEIS
jgi:DNA-directed RNA polymerase specialized sigma24 family protein